MISAQKVPLFDLVMCLSSTMDLIDPALVNHHKRVAYIASNIGSQMGLSIDQQNDLLIAGALHDIGALSLTDKLAALQFDFKNPQEHAEIGYQLLHNFEPFAKIAVLVRYHHVDWNEGTGTDFKGGRVPIGSSILHLADRVAILIKDGQEILSQVKSIRDQVEEQSNKMFMPQIVKTFVELSDKEYFWFDAVSQNIGETLRKRAGLGATQLDMKSLLDLSSLFRRIIDFRSRFTATHSSGVAATAEALARLMGFSERECLMIKVAGYLHDLGKLAVPAEILEKPAQLAEDEMFVMKRHTFLSYRTLECISELNIINDWGSLHHERLDGSGYPFHIKGSDIPMGSRIMAVADVFTALSEDRPYRKAMNHDRVLLILQEMSANQALDSDVVTMLKLHFDDINSIRMAAQATSIEEYRRFLQAQN